jgi:hypothetical protein
MQIFVRDLVEVIDERSPLYHRVGAIIGFTRGGRPIVRFRRRIRTWRHPIRGSFEVVIDVEQLGTVPPQ